MDCTNHQEWVVYYCYTHIIYHHPKLCWEDIVIFEKNLFLSYSDWSPELKDLLQSNAKIMAFQRRAYALYKERFAPGALCQAGDDPPSQNSLRMGCRFQVLNNGDRSTCTKLQIFNTNS